MLITKQNAAQLINASGKAPSQTAFITNRESKMPGHALEINQPRSAPLMCVGCRERPIQVWVRSDAARFSDARCDMCAERFVAHAGITDVKFDSIAGVPRPQLIDGVSVAEYPRECLAGVHDDVDLQRLWTLPSAVEEVARALSERIRRSLRPSERVALRVATSLAYAARRTQLSVARAS